MDGLTIQTILFSALSITSIFYDLKTKKIPLLLGYSFLLVGMLVGARDFVGLASVLAALAFGYLLWLEGAWGAADARFLAGLQAWSTLYFKEPLFFLGMFAVSGLLFLAWMLSTRQKLDAKNLLVKEKKHAYTAFMLTAFTLLTTLKLMG